MEKMAMEKQTTGLYLTGHPMDGYRDTAEKLGAVSIGPLLEDLKGEEEPHRYRDGQYIILAGVVSAARTRATKSNSLMSYITLEDDTGAMELIAFQRALDQGGSYLKESAAVCCAGRIDLRDEKDPQLMLDAAYPLEGLDDKTIAAIKNAALVVYFEDTKKRLGARCVIHEALTEELRQMLGAENVVVKG